MSGAPWSKRSLEEELADSLGHEDASAERVALPTHLAGEQLGSFRLARLLGMGAMGVVYLAEDRDLGREVAIKLMPSGDEEDAARRARFLQEARTAAKLVHPNVVQIFQVGEALGMSYIAMEFVNGVTADVAARQAGGRLSEAAAMARMLEAADALAMADTLGICHRDIKPANLLIAASGALKIADFGLASQRRMSESMAPGLALEGTPLYMSPERWEGTACAASADIYSLGCTFYHLTVGVLPFPVRDLVSCFHAHCEAPVPDPKDLAPEMDRDLAALLMRCMQKRSEDRPSAQEIAELLRDLLAVRRRPGRARGDTSSRAPDAPPSGPRSSPLVIDPPSSGPMSSRLVAGPPSSGQSCAPDPASSRCGGPPSCLDLFRLETYPFNDLHQPSFFWTGGPYGDVVAVLASRLARGQRITLLSGRPGSGRTFAAEMIRYQARAIHSYAIHPQLLMGMRPVEWLCHQLGVPVRPGADRRELLRGFLARALLDEAPDATVAVILDEVDATDPRQLEDLGELLDGPLASPRVAAVLVGSEDLPARLAAAGAPRAWSAAEPVTLRGMTLAEMQRYIDFRMTSIGGGGPLPLSVACQQFLHARSHGLPALVNVYCHNALVIAALWNEPFIQVETLRIAMKSKVYLSAEAAAGLLDEE